MEISKELLEKANACETAEELVALAKEYDYELSLNDAEIYLNTYDEGEAADEEMDQVNGGQNFGDDIFIKGKREIPFNNLMVNTYVYAYATAKGFENRKGVIRNIDPIRKFAAMFEDNHVYILPAAAYKFYIL